MDQLFNKGRLEDLSKLQYEGRSPYSLDVIKEILLKHIREHSISKRSELQDFLELHHCIAIEHS